MSSTRKPSLSTKEGVEHLNSRRAVGPAAGACRDLRSLGIDIDKDVVERLQALGLHRAWAVASQAAISLKEKSTLTKDKENPQQEQHFTSPIKYQHRMREKAEKIPAKQSKHLEIPAEAEREPIDSTRVSSIFQSLNNRESVYPANMRAEVLRLLKVFKSSYGRSPDRFIQQMMGRKSKKVRLWRHTPNELTSSDSCVIAGRIRGEAARIEVKVCRPEYVYRDYAEIIVKNYT